MNLSFPLFPAARAACAALTASLTFFTLAAWLFRNRLS